MDYYVDQITQLVALIKANIGTTLLIIAGLWIIQIFNALVGYRLNLLGIYPRHGFGLIGIPCSPFLHVNFNHLFFNTIPLLALIDFMLLGGTSKFIEVTAIIIFISGAATWLLGRPAIHIGASSVVMGYWGYLLFDAYQNPSVISIVLGIVCVYYFGGLILNFFPRAERVSWEGHVFGFIAGLAAAYWYH